MTAPEFAAPGRQFTADDVQRAARLIAEEHGSTAFEPGTPDHDYEYGPAERAQYEAEARAVLAAFAPHYAARVAEEIAAELDVWAIKQRAQASVAWNPQSRRDLESYAVAYRNAADVARRFAATGQELVADTDHPTGGPDHCGLCGQRTCGCDFLATEPVDP